MKSNLLEDNAKNREKAARLLLDGEVVALPTETVYGLAADALNIQAVEQIFKIKGRPLIDPLIVHFAKIAQLEKIADFPTSIVESLANAFWPGPLTIILKKKAIIPDLVTAGRQSVGVRMPAHPLTRQILLQNELLLAAPSANPFGYISPTRAEHVLSSLGGKVRYIFDGGPCNKGIESTIINLSNPKKISILRPGPIPKEAIEAVLNTSIGDKVQANNNNSGIATEGEIAPGQLKQHYSPRTRLLLANKGHLFSGMDKTTDNGAFVGLSRKSIINFSNNNKSCYWLSENEDIEEIAQNLFHMLRCLDEKKYDFIRIEIPENKGLGVAINDRLQRAATIKK